MAKKFENLNSGDEVAQPNDITADTTHVKKTGERAQTVEGTLTVGDLYVGGTRVEVLREMPSSPVADTLYFITGS